jgi:hypothetical protein
VVLDREQVRAGAQNILDADREEAHLMPLELDLCGMPEYYERLSELALRGAAKVQEEITESA